MTERHPIERKLFIGALVCISSVAALTAVYAYRARESALRGWENASQLSEELAVVYSDRNDAFRDLFRAKAGITKDETDKLAITKKLTAHLYDATLFTGKPWATTTNDARRYLQTTGGDVANMCATLSSTLIWALDLFGIEARPVSIAAQEFLSGDDPAATHTFVEVKLDGKAIAFDPTFNATYSCNGSLLALDANGIFECARSGGEVTPTYLSSPRPGRSLAEYPYRLEDLLFAIDAMARPDEFYPLSYPQDGWLQSARAVDGGKSETN
ncbi:MAG: hypothetical protein VR78_09270 [Hoeflea sp. BRH_c9]|nr:MAG: hypothetical protein VR78_09270 [Hoeflea sp. BRH_c9]